MTAEVLSIYITTMFLVSCFVSYPLEQLRRKMTNAFPLSRQSCLLQGLPFVTRHMSHRTSCGYFLGTSSSKICNFNHEFQAKSFCGGNFIIRRSFMAAIYHNKPLSPVSFFNCRNGLFGKLSPFSEASKMKWLVILRISEIAKLQMMVGVGIGKECGFTSNFDMLGSFTMRKTELRCKMVNSQ